MVDATYIGVYVRIETVNDYGRAVANGPVGPAMAGPIIEPVILIFFVIFFNLIYFPTGPIIEPVILIFAICVNTDSP